jgi:hypothetical protein
MKLRRQPRRTTPSKASAAAAAALAAAAPAAAIAAAAADCAAAPPRSARRARARNCAGWARCGPRAAQRPRAPRHLPPPPRLSSSCRGAGVPRRGATRLVQSTRASAESELRRVVGRRAASRGRAPGSLGPASAPAVRFAAAAAQPGAGANSRHEVAPTKNGPRGCPRCGRVRGSSHVVKRPSASGRRLQKASTMPSAPSSPS